MPRKYPELGIIFIDDTDPVEDDAYELDASGTYTRLWGNSRDNRLEGNAFDNYLNGDGGSDTLVGGKGNDTYRVDQPTDLITEMANEGIDTVWSNVSHTLGANVENLFLDIGGPGLSAIGNELSNRITGNIDANYLAGMAGDDTLDGGAGGDEMEGGVGNDVYVVDSEMDIVSELAADVGVDTVVSSITYTIADQAGLENITLAGTAAINATGNAGSNVLRGNAGVNVLTGGGGNDTYYIQNAGDQVVEATSAGGTADRVITTVSHTL